MTSLIWHTEYGKQIPTLIQSILVPVDFSEISAHAFAQAMLLADKYGARVDVLHVWSVPNYTALATINTSEGSMSLMQYIEQQAESSLNDFLNEFDPEKKAQAYLASGDPAEIILQRAPNYDLVLLGRYNRPPMLKEIVFGSVASQVLSKISVPTVTVALGNE